MSLGFVMLVHTAFDRAAQVVRYWAERDCPVAIHVDKSARPRDVKRFREVLKSLPNVRFCPRVTVEWGTWSMVQATQNAASALLDHHREVRHAYLASGRLPAAAPGRGIGGPISMPVPIPTSSKASPRTR